MLSHEYPVKDICKMMGVSRSGYYKWLRREPSSREINREFMVGVVEDIHSEHPTHGYRWVAAYIRINLQLSISDNFSYKCFQYLGIQSQTRHKIHYKPRKVKDKYPNLIYSTWDTVDRPRQVIVSDMTVIKYSWFFFELTMYFDVFTKEILTWHVAERRGHRDQYIDGLNDVINLLKGTDEPTVLHTDQGSVYASLAYNELIKDTLIVRSMSRAGKPTDNPVNESLNGWIKEELFIDFKIETCNSREEFEEAWTHTWIITMRKDHVMLSAMIRQIITGRGFIKGSFQERTLLGSERLMQHRSSSQNGRKWLEMRKIKNNVHFYKEKLANMDEIVYFCK
ncbi:MAG: DDE-type integrase/transposase/recombinase [Prevotella sp.]